jgi:hypothetical protein
MKFKFQRDIFKLKFHQKEIYEIGFPQNQHLKNLNQPFSVYNLFNRTIIVFYWELHVPFQTAIEQK